VALAYKSRRQSAIRNCILRCFGANGIFEAAVLRHLALAFLLGHLALASGTGIWHWHLALAHLALAYLALAYLALFASLVVLAVCSTLVDHRI
jgi:hypothetical protein